MSELHAVSSGGIKHHNHITGRAASSGNCCTARVKYADISCFAGAAVASRNCFAEAVIGNMCVTVERDIASFLISGTRQRLNAVVYMISVTVAAEKSVTA